MVSRSKTRMSIGALTLTAGIVIAVLSIERGDPLSLWLTPDQRGRLAYENLEFSAAADRYEDPAWRGTAAYAAGRYADAAEAFGRIAAAEGHYNRGNAFMKSFDYRKAIAAYEAAVEAAPDWPEAAQNLELARYVLDYVQDAREQGGTGELGADDYRFDNTEERGREMTMTRESAIELQSAEKWMRSVDTETREFLRIRFELEARQPATP